MTYYAIIYMTDGSMHARPYESLNGAKNCIKKLMAHEKWGPQVDHTKIIRKGTRDEIQSL